jgi:threonyl-tRNA synthetase
LLFDLIDEVGPGHVVWLPAGATIRRELQRWIEDLEIERGYQHVITPAVAKRELYVKSGHWDHFRDAMYPVMEREGEEYVLRPMNCPSHIMVYMSAQHSYRELPIRIAELGNMHRWEKSGQLTGMSRVRIMTLNDAHIFCADTAQVEQEVESVLHLMEEVYSVLGLRGYTYRLSLGDPNDHEKYVNNPPMWEAGEALLRRVMQKIGLNFYEAEGEAAFYGPKIDVQFQTAQGKDETGYRAGRFSSSRSVQARIRHGGRWPGSTNHGAPWRPLDYGAHGCPPYRGIRRQLPALAGAHAGYDHSHRGPPRALRSGGCRAAQGRAPAC